MILNRTFSFLFLYFLRLYFIDDDMHNENDKDNNDNVKNIYINFNDIVKKIFLLVVRLEVKKTS